MSTLCEVCHDRPATVFITKVVDNQAAKHQLCEECARQQAMGAAALGENWLSSLTGVDAEALQNLPLDDIMMTLFKSLEPTSQEDEEGESILSFEFSSDEDMADEEDEIEETLKALDDATFDNEAPDDDSTTESEKQALNSLLAGVFSDDSRDEDFGPVREVPAVRCPKCNTTWDRLRQDGRAGCAHCYTTFAEQLAEVMERVQHATRHDGKQPRAATKRRRRLEHLRTRRDHRLAMLQRRLQEALAGEKYEEAAKLRDQIKIVESTIVSDE